MQLVSRVNRLTTGPKPVAVKKQSLEEMADVYCMYARGEVYQGYDIEYPLSLTVFIRIDRVSENDDRVTYFHYWLTDGKEMYKIGSGGYIPTLHAIDEMIQEFEVLHFTPKHRARKIEDKEES